MYAFSLYETQLLGDVYDRVMKRVPRRNVDTDGTKGILSGSDKLCQGMQ